MPCDRLHFWSLFEENIKKNPKKVTAYEKLGWTSRLWRPLSQPLLNFNIQNECSFVSLRDVERAMKVMVWFYNHRNELGHLMDNTLTASEEENDDDGAGENGLDNEEDTLDKVGEIKLSKIYLSLKCLVVVVAIEQLAKSAVDSATT